MPRNVLVMLKINSKRFGVYYRDIVALGRFAEHSSTTARVYSAIASSCDLCLATSRVKL